MTFFYETLPIFLCGLAAGIVLMILVGRTIKVDIDRAYLNTGKNIKKKNNNNEKLHNTPLPTTESTIL